MIPLLVSLLLLFADFSTQSAQEYRLIKDLKENYDTIERPVRLHTEALPVKLRVLLQQIVDVDEKNGALTLVVWTQVSWTDYKLSWEPEEYGNITAIELPQKFIWKPDILLFNSADKFDANYPVNSKVSHTGDVFIAPPGIVKISCDLQMTWFPFDKQWCYLKYGSWTYSGSQLNLTIDDAGLLEGNQIDLAYFVRSEEVEILSTPAERISKYFEGVPYIELKFHLIFKRRSFYYVVNWIIPAVLISMSNILQFMMPTGGGEKITLQTTNVLATLVFLSQTAKSTPPTSDSIPVLSQFFSASLCLMGASTVATVLIMNVHFRSASLRKLAPWTRKVFLEILPRFVFLPAQPVIEVEEVKRIEEQVYKAERIKKMASALSPRLSLSFDDYAIYSHLEGDVNEVISILKVFEEKLKADVVDRQTESDFRFMAKVLDRICMGLYGGLFLVTFLTLLITSAIKN